MNHVDLILVQWALLVLGTCNLQPPGMPLNNWRVMR